jgi:hypothetical protein
MKLHVRSLLFRSPRSKLLAAGASFAAIALFTLILPATVASGASVSTSTLKDAGVLRLRLGATDLFRYEPTPNSPTNAVNQTVSASSCKLNLSPAGSLVTFSPPANAANNVSPYAGFFDDSIGVGSRNEGNGQPCGKIDPGQTLTMNLGSGLAGKMIDYAEIDLELKFGGAVTVTGYLVQGTTETQVGLPETYTSTGSDSGPDSGDLDNYRVRFPRSGTTTVNRLVFSVGSSGSGSLEGGADGTGPCDAADAAACGTFSLGQSLANTTDTLFHLLEADGALDCTTNNVATQGGNGTPTSTLTRVENVGGATCTPIPYNLDSSIGECEDVPSYQCILLQKDLLGQNAQFFWHVAWVPEPGEYQEEDTQFNYGFGYQDLQLCLADDGDLDAFPELPPKAAGAPAGAPDPDPWCVVFTSTTLDPATGLVTVEEEYYGSGDPLGKRG